jgi:hypothetical protein
VGVPGLPRGLTVEDMCDWDKICAVIADTTSGITFALTKNRLTPSFEAAEQVAGIVTQAIAKG